VRRYKRVTFGRQEARVVDNSLTMLPLLEASPLSGHFKPPELFTPKEILRFMLAMQQRAFGYTILQQLSYVILMRNLKLLLAEYGREDVLAGIILSIHRGKFPGSTKLVKDMILCLPSRIPGKTTMQNKS